MNLAEPCNWTMWRPRWWRPNIQREHRMSRVTHYVGVAAGYVLTVTEGPVLYHAGDTAVFGDMKLIRELYGPEVAMLPIGGHFTMGPKEAALATQFLAPKIVLPLHFGTFRRSRAHRKSWLRWWKAACRLCAGRRGKRSSLKVCPACVSQEPDGGWAGNRTGPNVLHGCRVTLPQLSSVLPNAAGTASAMRFRPSGSDSSSSS